MEREVADFLSAARYTDRDRRLPHQDAAWNWAWRLLSAEQQTEFLEMFRAEPAPKPAAPVQVANSWDGILAAAKRHGARHPELVAAQWLLESGGGFAFAGHNNPFGLKGPGTWKQTEEVVNGQTVTIRAEFRDFDSLDEAVQVLVKRWYKDYTGSDGRRWNGVNRALDREEAARLLVIEGYATDPNYASKLVKLMNEHAPRSAVKPPSAGDRRRWVSQVKALNLSQPDAITCQAAAIAMATGTRDVQGVRRQLDAEAARRGSSAGDPAVMAAVIERTGVPYRYEGDACLEQVYGWLKAGEFLVTHGWFTSSGHVLGLDGLKQAGDGLHLLDVKDPYGEFDAPAWRYKDGARFFDGYYSDRCIYAACVAGAGAGDAAAIYKRQELDIKAGGMWVHRFLVA